jgi:hypothetical protein
MSVIYGKRSSLAARRFIERVRKRIRHRFGLPPHPEIKIHGLLRSGTNYLETLLRRNFYVECLAPWEHGWKHGPCEYSKTGRYLFLVKDPYAWLVSFRNWERLHNRTRTAGLAEFAREAVTHPRLAKAWDVSTPIQAWNRTLSGWRAVDGKANTLFIRYEDLLRDLEAQLERVRRHFGLMMRRREFVDIRSRADAWKTPHPRKALDVAYYLHEKYVEEFDEPARAVLRADLDPGLLAHFHYRFL